MDRARVASCLIIMAIALLVVTSHAIASPDNLELIAENSHFQLYIDPATTEIALVDLRQDVIWYSNPPGSSNKHVVSIVYAVGDNENEINTYNASVELGQYQIERIPNGVKVTYDLGQTWRDRDYIPNMISKQRFDELVASQVTPEEAEMVTQYFNLISLVIPEHERPVLGGVDLDAILGDYTVISYTHEEQRAYFDQLNETLAELEALPSSDEIKAQVSALKQEIRGLERTVVRLPDERTLIRDLLNRVMEQRADITRFADFTREDFAQLYNNPTYVFEGAPAWVEAEIVDVFKKAGYTPEVKQIDHLLNNITPPAKNHQVFKVAVEYVLEDDTLVVRVPAADIDYPNEEPVEFLKVDGRVVTDEDGLPVYDPNGRTVSHPILTIKVLEFFGAIGASDGYLVIPDGSGAILDTRGTGTVQTLRTKVYGSDNSIAPLERKSLYTEICRLPIFGLAADGRALFGIIEAGDAMAEVVARTVGPAGTYNQIYPQFTMMPKRVIALPNAPRMPVTVETRMTQVSTVTAYQPEIYFGDLQIRYTFLYESDASYVGMANYYRDYLIQNHGLQEKEHDQPNPFILEFLGAFTYKRPVLGVPINTTQSLTTFAEAQTILTDLYEQGIDNITVRYTGWLKDGVEHVLPTKAPLEKAVGSVQELQDFTGFLDRHGSALFLDVNFMTINRNKLSFSQPGRYSAKFLGGEPAFVYEYNYASQLKQDQLASYIIRPREIPNLVRSFVNDFKKYDVDGISLNQMGEQLNSDYDPKQLVNRQDALRLLASELQKLKEQGYKLMVTGGNAYAMPYADVIVDVPMDSSRYFVQKDSIPFLQIAWRGLVNYAGRAINLAQDYRFTVLKMIETGASFYYVFTHQDSSVIKDTQLSSLYSPGFYHWRDSLLDLYAEVQPLFEAIGSAPICNHQKLDDNVYLTEFVNGISVIVNYNLNEVELDGIIVPGEGFRWFVREVSQ